MTNLTPRYIEPGQPFDRDNNYIEDCITRDARDG